MKKLLSFSFHFFTFLLLIFIFSWILGHEQFSFDNYAYTVNSLSLTHLSPEPFGYFEYRPPLVPILIAPLVKLFYSPDFSLNLMKLTQAICSCSLFFLIFIFWKYWLRDKSLILQGFILWSLAGNRLILSSTLFSMTDLLASTFAIASFLIYSKHRKTYPNRTLIFSLLLWSLASLTRYNYFTLIIIFFVEEIWRRIKRENSPSKVSLLISFLLIPGAAFLIYFAPYLAKYKQDAWLEISQHLQSTHTLFVKLSQNHHFVYDQLVLFSIPWTSLLLSLCGLFLIRKRYPLIFRLLILYTVHFIVTHFILTPHQYIRFLAPFLLPYLLSLTAVLEFIKEKLGKAVFSMTLIILFGHSLIPLAKHIDYLNSSFFDKNSTFEISQKLSQGTRTLWYGKSYPFSSREGQDYHVLPVSHNFHYAPHIFKVHSGRECQWVPRSDNEENSNPHQIPITLIPYLKNNDSLFLNKNNAIFYHSRDLSRAKPIVVIRVARISQNSRDLPSKEELQHSYPGGFFSYPLSQDQHAVSRLDALPNDWIKVTKRDGRWEDDGKLTEQVIPEKLEIVYPKEIHLFHSYQQD